MAGALEVFRDKLAESRRLEDAFLVARLAREKRVAALEGYTQDFGQSIAGVMSQLEQASKGMKQAAIRMTSVLGQTSTQASSTVGEATEASGNLTAVAAAVEQMSASVGEISRQVAYAAKVATAAVREAVAADGRMRPRTCSANRIGDILGVISDVAARTNLLAVNVTIQAAHAGEAGKGFAVVASEVKQLAAQTARATEEVATQIAAMRMAADEAASAMGGISRTIARIDEVATTSTAAVEEQGASTREITQRLQGMAGSTGGVTQAMGAMLRLAEEAGEVSGGVEATAAGIRDQAATLRAEVESNLHNLRDDAKDHRSYERRRVQGGNATVVLAGRELVLPLTDISAAGVGLRFHGQARWGSPVTIALPGTAALGARIVRC